MLKVALLVRYHDQMLSLRSWPDQAGQEKVSCESALDLRLSEAIDRNHQHNTLLWREEDQARRTDVPAEHIVASKRRIDILNQQRNDAVEQIDDVLLSLLKNSSRATNARQHSETPGAIIDRLSILALKIFHMAQQLDREDIDTAHIARCAEKLHRLETQRYQLAGCLEALLTDLQTGRAYFNAYRQFKMYNDPALNLWLRRR